MTLSTSLAYGQWQALLAEEYFGEDRADRPVSLFISDDELIHLAAPGDLATAVTWRLTWADTASPFTPIALEVSRWEQGDQHEPPPCLPLLAVTVLAATRMHRDEVAAPHAYYIRLAELLDPRATPAGLQRLRDRLSHGFDDVVLMWRALHEWLECHGGRRGISTIRTGGTKWRIGYPLSQALVRREDQHRLTQFFAALNLDQAGNPGETALLHHLRLWTTRPRGLSPGLLAALAADATATPLGAVLSSLANSWDGVVRESGGLRKASLRACADTDSWSVWWELDQLAGVAEDVLRLPDGREFKAVGRDGYTMYDLSGDLPDIGATLRHGVRAIGERMAAYVPNGELVAMRRHPVVGGWVTQPGITPFEEHVLLVAPPADSDVRKALHHAAAHGWKQARSTLVPGWVTYLKVLFADPDALEQVAPSLRETVALAVRHDTGPRPVLCHGLPVAFRFGRHHYFAGGEPDLLLPAGVEPRMVRASLDGIEDTLRATGFPLPLRMLGPYTGGRHELRADGTDLSFTVTPTLGTQAIQADPSGGTVQGAWLGSGEGDPEPVLVRRGLLSAHAIHTDGTIATITEPATPAWLETHLGALARYRFDYLPPPTAAWIVEESRLGWSIRSLHTATPLIRTLDPQSQEVWRTLIAAQAQAPGHDHCWRQYLHAVEGCLGR